jgi:hypothetical protein
MSARVTGSINLNSLRIQTLPAAMAIPPSRRESAMPRTVRLASYAVDFTATIAYLVAFALLFHVPPGLETNVPLPLMAAGIAHTLAINARRGHRFAFEALTLVMSLILIQPVLGPIGQIAAAAFLASILLPRTLE